MDLVGKNVLVIGKKSSGIASCELLVRMGANAYIYDDYDLRRTSFFDVESVDEVLDFIDFAVLSPAVPISSKTAIALRKRDIEVLSELDLGFLTTKAKTVGVTGTNGKTTTVMLIQHILEALGYKAYALGNIGTPFTSMSDKLDKDEFAIVEASSFQLEQSICFSPEVSAITNITPDHLNRHLNGLNYYATKTKLFSMQSEYGKSIINYDDRLCKSIVTRNQPFYYSLGSRLANGITVDELSVCLSRDFEMTPLVSLNDNSISEEHNIVNLECALSAVINLVGSNHYFNDCLKGFEYPRYRNQFIAKIGNISVYNDSKSTNSGSCIASVNALTGRTLLILGGQGKGESYQELLKKIASKVVRLYLVGENAIDIYYAGKELGMDGIMTLFADLRSAVAKGLEEDVDNLVFSPASSSFDSYANYIERGEKFDEIIRSYL